MSTTGNQPNTDNSYGNYNNDNQNKRNHAPRSNSNKPSYSKNKNDQNANTNKTNVALRPQNFNSVANDKITPQAPNKDKNLKPSGGPKKQNKNKGKNANTNTISNANDDNKVETSNQQETIETQNPDRIKKSLSNEQIQASSFPTSISLDNIGYFNRNMNKISPNKMTNSASFSNTCNLVGDLIRKQEETFPIKENLNVEIVPETETVTDEAKQNLLDESETSLEFTSCCSTPMSINNTKSEIKTAIELEHVIKSLDFKSNDILAIDMEQFNQTIEENEETTTYIDNVINVLLHQEQEEEQISVIEARQFENEVPALAILDEYLQKIEDNSNANTLTTVSVGLPTETTLQNVTTLQCNNTIETEPVSNIFEFIPVQTQHENLFVEQIIPIIDILKETSVTDTFQTIPVQEEIQLTIATQETQIKELVPEIPVGETALLNYLVENETKEISALEIPEISPLSNMIGNVIEEIQIKEVIQKVPAEMRVLENVKEKRTTCLVSNLTESVSKESSVENIINEIKKMDDFKTNTEIIDLKQEKGEVTAYVQTILLKVLENTQLKAPESAQIDLNKLFLPRQLNETQKCKDEEVLDNNFVLITSPIIMDEEKSFEASGIEPLLAETVQAYEIEAETEANPFETATTNKSSKQDQNGNDNKADPAVDCFPCSIL